MRAGVSMDGSRGRSQGSRQSAVVDEAAGQPQLGVGGNDEPGPTAGLCGGADAACSPAQRSLDEAKRMLDVKTSQVGAPAQVEVGLTVPRPPQPQRLQRTSRRFGKVLDLDADDAAADDRWQVVTGPPTTAVELRVKHVPRGFPHVAAAEVVYLELGVGGGPGGGLGDGEAVPVASWPACGTVGTCRGVGVEHLLGADADQHLGSGVGEPGTERPPS